MSYRIGLIVGMEDDFPPEFIARINRVPGSMLSSIGGASSPGSGIGLEGAEVKGFRSLDQPRRRRILSA